MRSDGVNEEEYLTLSGVQHYAFCPRQWALIFVEQQWQDNERTVDGSLMHARAHDETLLERRGDTLTARGLRVVSHALRVTGVCDVVEFHLDSGGISLPGQDGCWQPYPVEYKRGAPKSHDADELQLCGQAMCLEEMLLCEIPEGSLYYGETRRRQVVAFTPELRGRVRHMLEAMQDDMARGHTPSVKADKRCAACSMKEICLPGLRRSPPVAAYLQRRRRRARNEKAFEHAVLSPLRMLYLALENENVVIYKGEEKAAQYPLKLFESLLSFSYKGASRR